MRKQDQLLRNLEEFSPQLDLAVQIFSTIVENIQEDETPISESAGTLRELAQFVENMATVLYDYADVAEEVEEEEE